MLEPCARGVLAAACPARRRRRSTNRNIPIWKGEWDRHGSTALDTGRARRRRSRPNTRRSSNRTRRTRPPAARATTVMDLHPARHAAHHDRLRADGVHRHAGRHLHPDRATSTTIRRIYTDGRAWPRTSSPLHGLLDRQMDRRGRRRPLRRARSRDARHQGPARLRRHRHAAARGQPDASSRSGSTSTRPTIAILHNEITTIDNALTAAVDGEQEILSATPAGPDWLEGCCAENNQHVRIGNENYISSAATAS